MQTAFLTPTGIPWSDVNLLTGEARGPQWDDHSSLSEAGTLALEWAALDAITGTSHAHMRTHTRTFARARSLYTVHATVPRACNCMRCLPSIKLLFPGDRTSW